MADVFPPRDLPGRAEEWGRQVERRIESGEASEEQLEQKVDNGLRATGGQLAVMANQISDLSERSTLVNRLYGTYNVSTNASGYAVGGWSEYDFTITRPRQVVIDFAYSATLSQAVAGTSVASSAIGFTDDPLAPVTLLPLTAVVGGAAMYMGSIGATSDSILGMASLKLTPGRYRIYLAVEVTGPLSADSANMQLQNGISTLTIGQADESITVSDIPQYIP